MVVMQCNCENSACKVGHIAVDDDQYWTQCGGTATVAVQWVGGICGPCARYMPMNYIIGDYREGE